MENSSVETFGVNAERYPVNAERYPVNIEPIISEKQKSVGKTAQKIIDMVISDPSINRERMAEKLGISIDGVKKQIKKLCDLGILVHEGSDKAGIGVSL